MTEGKRLTTLIAQGHFVLSVHALERHQSRAISETDIRCCARTARAIRWQETHESWRIDGKDSDGTRLTIVAVFEDEAIIITVFRPEEGAKPARRKR